MNRFITAIAIIALVALPLLRPGIDDRVSAADGYCLDQDSAQMLQLINDYRQQNGQQPLTPSPTLGAAALEHSQDMATQGYFDPIGSDGSTAEDRMANADYPLDQATDTGENLYWGTGDFVTAEAALAWWQSSPDSDAILLSGAFQAIGIGVATDPATGKKLWTATFASYVDAQAESCSDGAGTGDEVNSGGSVSSDTESDGESIDLPEATGAGPIVVIYQCPDTANPEADEVADCAAVDAPDAVLIETSTNTSYPFADAPRHDDVNFVAYWDALPAGTYRIDAGLPGMQWMMVQPDGFTPPDHADGDTFVIERGTTRFLVQLYIYGSADEDVAQDSDGDGYDDGEEVESGTDPLDPGSYPDATRLDSDDDGLYDDDETDVYGTDPYNPDTDGDGVSDGQEVFDGTDPLDPDSFI